MIYWFTGQPGHGKTLHAIEMLLDFKKKGRTVYACNVRGFNYEKTGVEPMTPDEFKDWMNFLPDGAVALVDEAYQHKMLPKRAPSTAVPPHVENLATHRHRGIDFIFVCQSPDTQCDTFCRDLIDWHYHVRRKFGTKYVAIRKFDKYEANAEKATPITIERKQLPKAIFGTYESTELDTTQKRVPWYFYAFAIGLPVVLGFMYWTFGGMGERLVGEQPETAAAVGAGKATEAPAEGAAAKPKLTAMEYLERFTPRVPSQPWTAPAYDELQVSSEPPRLFCMTSGDGDDAMGKRQPGGCSCITEQGTRYTVDIGTCRIVAISGQYEPYFDERDSRHMDGETSQDHYRQELADNRARRESVGVGSDQEMQAKYGRMRNKDAPTELSNWRM